MLMFRIFQKLHTDLCDDTVDLTLIIVRLIREYGFAIYNYRQAY